MAAKMLQPFENQTFVWFSKGQYKMTAKDLQKPVLFGFHRVNCIKLDTINFGLKVNTENVGGMPLRCCQNPVPVQNVHLKTRQVRYSDDECPNVK
jgi:hypothetical protein